MVIILIISLWPWLLPCFHIIYLNKAQRKWYLISSSPRKTATIELMTTKQQQSHQPSSPTLHKPDEPEVAEGSRWVVGNGALLGRKRRMIWRSIPSGSSVTAISMMNRPVPVTHLTPGPVDTRRWKTTTMKPTSLSNKVCLFSHLHLFPCARWVSAGREQP